jgi:hypothetical protein
MKTLRIILVAAFAAIAPVTLTSCANPAFQSWLGSETTQGQIATVQGELFKYFFDFFINKSARRGQSAEAVKERAIELVKPKAPKLTDAKLRQLADEQYDAARTAAADR